MAIYNTPDGRQVVGSVESGNDYHGFNGKRDIIIQLTADGATTDGLNALEYLKAYAVEQNKQGNPIFPNGTRVWISANGYTKAVEADDVTIDGTNITIGGIVWNGTAWDYSKAGQGETGLPAVTPSDAGKVLAVNNSGVWGASDLPTNRNSDTLIQIAAEYTNGSYVCNNTFDTNALYNMFQNGTDLRLTLTVDGSDYQLYPTLIGFTRDGFLTYETYDPQSGIKLGVHFDVSDEIVTVSISEIDNRFIVTLTPTALDYSGTMDKTVAEIDAAYEAGLEIWFRVEASGMGYLMEMAGTGNGDPEYTYPSFNAKFIANDTLLYVNTGYTNDGTKATYLTKVYTLTPAT